MDKDATILGKFYLKNGLIVEEKLVINEEECKVDVDSVIQKLRDSVEHSFRTDSNFHFTFNDTTFKGSELAAVTIKKVE